MYPYARADATRQTATNTFTPIRARRGHPRRPATPSPADA